MNVELIRQFIQDLRDHANDKRATAYLRVGDAFCDLGLLCHRIDPDAWVKSGLNTGSAWNIPIYAWHQHTSSLPPDTAIAIFGENEHYGPALIVNQQPSTIATLSDNNIPRTTVADALEAWLKEHAP